MQNTLTLAIKDLDRLLRGEATQLGALQKGRIEIEASRLPALILGLGVLYGACMGCFALANKDVGAALLQTLSSMGKVPVLFFATLLVTFPSLYVFNALVGSRLTPASVWRLLVSSLAVMMAVLASLGPVVAFFSLSTTNYPFMLLLNVAVFALSGFLGLKFLLHTLHRLTVVLYKNAPAELVDEADAKEKGALAKVEARAVGRDVRQVFVFWVFAFGVVGMQMSWVLRPFISAPDRPFMLFSPRESNFYAAVWETIMKVVFGA